MKKVIISNENCEAEAAMLVEVLFGKRLVIVSYAATKDRPIDLRILPEVKILAGFTFEKGRLNIPLIPRRNICWDLTKEKVSLTYRDDGSIVLERVINENNIIYRTIMAF